MNIIEAIKDPNLFRPYLADKDGSIDTWRNWMHAMRCLYGLPLPKSSHELVRLCTGRDPALLPREGFKVAMLLTGRRCGKSRKTALCGAHEALFGGHEAKLDRGEQGLVGIFAPTRRQSQVIKSYLRSVFDTDLLRREVVRETKDGFELRNGNLIEILTGDFRAVRGFTLIAAIVDEAAFFGVDEEARVKSDTELITAIEPGLATTGGRLLVISTPYAKRGYCWNTFQRYHGNNLGSVLVWNAATRTMNPKIPQSVVDRALQDDLGRAKAEWLGLFRDDVGLFIPRELIERAVAKDRTYLPWRPDITYSAFCDMSGGRGDDAALAIAHRDQDKVVLDVLRCWRAPFSPQHVVREMIEDLRRYRLNKVTGDNYAADWVSESFRPHQVSYAKAEMNKNQLYAELLPRLASHTVELLDDGVLVDQLASLERRTRSGGRDIIDHPPGQKDDVANAVAGVVQTLAARRRCGAILSRYQKLERKHSYE